MVEDRILLLAVRGRDSDVLEQILGKDGRVCVVCRSLEELAARLEEGAGATVLTEESISADCNRLESWLTHQPPWSDFPFILLATKRLGRRPKEAQAVLAMLGNVVVLERPIHSETLSSAVTSALRGRSRQYEARRQLQDLKGAEERLTQLNESLETRINQRTAELSAANNKLMQEISERERAQAALFQAQKMEAVGQLTGGIAHDFNNLLTVIFGNLELIRRRADDDRVAQLADYAKQAADRAGKLTQQLLAFSRSQKLSLAPVNLNDMLSGMNDLLARTIGTQITIAMELDPSKPWAMADANQLELAVLNLAINARDAMPKGGHLRIATTVRPSAEGDGALDVDSYGVITVADDGIGIPHHLIDKVFDPFFTTKPVGRGTGLGLSQVYGIAQQSGGTVRIDSEEGRGSTVEIWLPSAPAEAIAEHTAERRPIEAVRSNERVLVIDDDDGVRQFIVDCLEMSGYQVTASANGPDGLAQMEASPPQLLIVDYAMPGMSGVEVVTEARRRTPGLPIILATGYADMYAVDAVMEPERVLRKPFKPDDLNAAVHAALAARDAA